MRHRVASVGALTVTVAILLVAAGPAHAVKSTPGTGKVTLTGGVEGKGSGGTATCDTAPNGKDHVVQLDGFTAGGKTWNLSVTVLGGKRKQTLTPTSKSGVLLTDTATTALYLSDDGAVQVGPRGSSVKTVATLSDQYGAPDTTLVLDIRC